MPAHSSACTVNQPMQWLVGSAPSTQCPVRHAQGFGWIFQLYECYQRNSLPKAGGAMDQPAWVMDALSLIDGVVNQDVPET